MEAGGGSRINDPKPGTTSDGSKGWKSTYTIQWGVAKGKTYKSYKQDLGYYKDKPYLDKTFSKYGCPLTTAAIMLNVLGYNVDPYELFEITGPANPADAINIYSAKKLSKGNLYKSVSVSGMTDDEVKELIAKWLKKGYPVGIYVGKDDGVNQHYMVITDYNPNNGKFYVEGVHTGYDFMNGWRNYEDIYEYNSRVGIITIYIPVGDFKNGKK